MASIELGEELVPDARLEKAFYSLIKEYPALVPMGAEFVTWIQEPLEFEKDGEQVRVDACAVIAVLSPNPRNLKESKLTRLTLYLDEWRRLDREFLMTGGRDPLIMFLRAVSKEHIETIKNLSELI